MTNILLSKLEQVLPQAGGLADGNRSVGSVGQGVEVRKVDFCGRALGDETPDQRGIAVLVAVS
jgi:hypothetical protein